MKKTIVSMLVLTIIALTLPAPASGQQTTAEARASAVWNSQVRKSTSRSASTPKPASSPAKKSTVIRRTVVGGPATSASSSAVVHVTGRDHSTEISALRAEIAELRARPQADPVALARLEGRLDGLTSRVATLEVVADNHEQRLVALETAKPKKTSKWKAFGTFLFGVAVGVAADEGIRALVGGGGNPSYGRTGGFK